MGEVGTAAGPYYRPADVARMLRCSEWWVKEQARRRRIPYCWIGGSYLFTDDHIAAIVRLFEVRPVEPMASVPSRVRKDTSRPGTGQAGRLTARVPRRARTANGTEAA